METVAKVANHQKLIGATIRKHRKKARLSQEKLAEKADLHPVHIGEVERGEETVSIAALVGIAKACGVRVRNLVWDL